MDKNTLFIFCFILILLSGVFSLYHSTEMTNAKQEILLSTPIPRKTQNDLQQIVLPDEFIDYVKQSDGNAQGSLSAKEFSLKKFGFTVCLNEMSSTTNFWKKEGSESAFMEASEGSLDQIETVEQLAKSYAIKNIASTSARKKLWVSECLDFYDSNDLRDAVKSKATLSQ